MRVVVIRMHTLDLPSSLGVDERVDIQLNPREGQPATRCIANGTRGTTSPMRFPERNTSDNLSWDFRTRFAGPLMGLTFHAVST